MSSICKCKSYSHFFHKNIRVYAIFNDQSFNDTLTNDIISFEKTGPRSFWMEIVLYLELCYLGNYSVDEKLSPDLLG